MSDDGSLKKPLLGVNRLKRLFQTKNNEEGAGRKTKASEPAGRAPFSNTAYFPEVILLPTGTTQETATDNRTPLLM